MELTLTVHVPRRRPRPVDVVVDWAGRHTAAELCAALAEHLGEPVPGLTVGGHGVDPSSLVGMPPLLDGASVVVAPHERGTVAPPPRAAVLDLVVVGGPDAGRSHELVPPEVAVGRAAVGGLVIADAALSRLHAVFRIGPSGVTVEDVGSTNGVLVDGVRVGDGVTVVDTTSTIVMGASTLRLRRGAGPGPAVGQPGDGTVVVRAGAGREPANGPLEVEGPLPPPDRPRPRVPWVAAVAPVPVAVALAVFFGPQLLAFALLGPLVLIATALGDRWGSGRTRRRELHAHRGALAAAKARLNLALSKEAARLQRAHPDAHEVLTTAERRSGLWVGGSGLAVRLGLGDIPTRVAWVEGSRKTHPVMPRVPVVVDLVDIGGLAVVGPPDVSRRLLASLVGQLCTAHPPHTLSVAVVSDDADWDWVGRMPHAVAIGDLLATAPAPTGSALARDRSRTASAVSHGHRLLIVADDGARARALAARAREAGVLLVVAVTSQAFTPPGCRASLVHHDAADRYVLDTGTDRAEVTLDLVGPWWSDRVSRALAPLRLRSGARGGELPSGVTLAEVLGIDEVTEEDVVAWWRHPSSEGGDDAPASPSAVIGVGPEGPFSIDLRRDGPHVLVGGTTGSGKSEFLRTLVTSLALAHPPEHVTFVLVDFKGGAAFGSCADLPHVVGLVTDLDEHLVSRALRSLGAELRRRERLFAAAGARDLEDYARVAGPAGEPVPRLVVVIDELRALVDEVPDFVSGLVRLAALGRSLGVHLVLATQRPAGAVTAEIQANVNLRVAFRVRDRADSVDVIEDPGAASIRSSTPGRALARGGDGGLVTFQAAIVTGPGHGRGDHLRVRDLGASDVHADAGEAGATASRVVGVIRSAHRRTGGNPPRSPWLPPLPARLPWSPASTGPVDGAVTHSVAVGLVEEPDLQRVSPLLWTTTGGTWLLAGRPRSGRTTALRSLVLSAASRCGPRELHVHVVDPSTALADLEQLPHVGTRVGVDDPRALAGLVAHLRAEVERRAGARAPGVPAVTGFPTVLVLIDGWEQLVESQPSTDPDGVVGRLVSLFRDGSSVGVIGAVVGGRSLLQPRWLAAAGQTFLLGAVDPLDAAVTGLRAADLPGDPPPGRAIRVHDRREVQFMLPTARDVDGVADRWGPRPEELAAWRLRSLPSVVRCKEVVVRPHGSVVPPSDRPVQLPLALSGTSLAVWSWQPEQHGRRVVVAGSSGSGRTNALRVIAESACAASLPVVVVTRNGMSEQRDFAGAPVIGPADVQLLVEVRRRHPHLVLLVDDADRLDDSAVLPVLREIVDLADRDKGLVAVTTTTTSLATRFRGVDVDVARHRTGILLNPAAHDGDVWGVGRIDDLPRVPGRGVVVSRGAATEIQVFLAEGSAASIGVRGGAGVIGTGRVPGAASGEDLGIGLPGDPRGDDRHHRHHDHQPADGHAGSLHQAEPDGEQQRVPDDGGGPRPRAVAEPPPGQQGQADRADEDEQGRHEHPAGVASFADDELVDVERREPGERQGLHPGQQGGETAGPP